MFLDISYDHSTLTSKDQSKIFPNLSKQLGLFKYFIVDYWHLLWWIGLYGHHLSVVRIVHTNYQPFMWVKSEDYNIDMCVSIVGQRWLRTKMFASTSKG